MGVHCAYKEWRVARDLLLQDDVSSFSSELRERQATACRKLRVLARHEPETVAEAALKIEAALDGVDLPEPACTMVFDALAWLKAQ